MILLLGCGGLLNTKNRHLSSLFGSQTNKITNRLVQTSDIGQTADVLDLKMAIVMSNVDIEQQTHNIRVPTSRGR